jgi:hypothetical protein
MHCLIDETNAGCMITYTLADGSHLTFEVACRTGGSLSIDANIVNFFRQLQRAVQTRDCHRLLFHQRQTAINTLSTARRRHITSPVTNEPLIYQRADDQSISSPMLTAVASFR